MDICVSVKSVQFYWCKKSVKYVDRKYRIIYNIPVHVSIKLPLYEWCACFLSHDNDINNTFKNIHDNTGNNYHDKYVEKYAASSKILILNGSWLKRYGLRVKIKLTLYDDYGYLTNFIKEQYKKKTFFAFISLAIPQNVSKATTPAYKCRLISTWKYFFDESREIGIWFSILEKAKDLVQLTRILYY